MQLKCPGCARTLKIPDTAAGKVVKCPCGKQLRVPASSGGTKPEAAPRTTAPAPRRATSASRPAASRPAAPASPASAPAQPRPIAANPLQVDAGSFDDLSDADWAPVQSAPIPTAGRVASNPYAAPNSTSDTSGSASGPLASKGQRFANFMIDQVFAVALSFAVGMVIGIVAIASKGGDGLSPEETTRLGGIADGIAFLVILLYYIVMEAAFGATIGKLCTGTRVVSAKGGSAGFGAIIGRTFARFIPFEPFSFLGSTGTGWHDTLSGTRVIQVR